MILFDLLLTVGVTTAIVTWLSNRNKIAQIEASDTQETKPVEKRSPMNKQQAKPRQNQVDARAQASQLRTWLTSINTSEESLQKWYLSLSEEESSTVSQELASYCESFGMGLDLLLENKLLGNQSLKDTMTDMVVTYLTSRQKAAQMQNEAQVFQIYQEFNQNPASKPDFARNLFAQLVDNGLVVASTSDLLESDLQKRQEYFVNTIRQTARNNPVEFNKALKAVVEMEWEVNNLPF